MSIGGLWSDEQLITDTATKAVIAQVRKEKPSRFTVGGSLG